MKFLSVLLLLSGCGYDSKHREPPQREEVPIQIKSFETRLRNNLLIKGVRCTGSEVVTTDQGSQVCATDEYLVTVDDENFCTPEGCTEVFVEPLIAGLRSSGGDSITTFYEIVPNQADDQSEDTLASVLLRTRVNELPTVVFRDNS